MAWRAVVLQATTVLYTVCAIELMTDSGRPVRQLHNLGHANLATASAPTCLNTRGRSPDTPQSQTLSPPQSRSFTSPQLYLLSSTRHLHNVAQTSLLALCLVTVPQQRTSPHDIEVSTVTKIS